LARALVGAARHWALYPPERDGRGEHPRAVVEALDPEALDIDPLKFM